MQKEGRGNNHNPQFMRRFFLSFMLLVTSWIILADDLLPLFNIDPQTITYWQSIQWPLLVVVSAGMLYVLHRSELRTRRQMEYSLYQSNRALRALSECNQSLIRATDEAELLQNICRHIVDVGGYRLAWVGEALHDEARTVRPIAQAGFENGYLQTIMISWHDNEYGRGPTGTAIRTAQLCVVRNILEDPAFAPWRTQALLRGYAAVIAMPLIIDGQVIGALSIYAGEADAFDEEEVRLLHELADDLAYGIQTLRTRVARRQAEASLRASYEQMYGILESMSDAFFSLDSEWNFVYVNRETERILRLSRTFLIGRNIWDIFPEAVNTDFYHRYQQVREQQVALSFESFYVPLDTWFEVRAYPSQGGLSAYFRDITAQKRAASYRATQFAVTRVLADAETYQESLPRLLQAFCEGIGWELGEMWQTDAQAEYMYWQGNWHSPAVNVAAFTAASRAMSFAPQSCLVGRVWASGQPEWISDVETEPTLLRAALVAEQGLHSVFAFPIWNGKDVTGVMVFFSRTIRAPDDDMLVVMNDMGSQIGQFVARKQAEADLARQAEVDASIAELSQKLLSSATLNDVAAMVLDHAQRLTGSTFGFVGYIDPQTGALVCPTMSRDIWDVCQVPNKQFVFDRFGGLWGWVLEHRQSLLTNTPADDPRSSGTPAGHIRIESFLGVPALIGQTLLGQVALANAYHPYTDQDLKVVERLTWLYALAIQRQRHEETLHRYARRLQHMHTIDRSILSAHSPTEIARAVLDQLQHLMAYEYACITLFNTDHDTAEILAAYANHEVQTEMDHSIPLSLFGLIPAFQDKNGQLVSDICALSPIDTYMIDGLNPLRSFIGVPLICQSRTIGTLALGSTVANVFKVEDLEVTHEVANQVAIAIQQAQLFAEVQEARTRLRSLSQRLVAVQESERRHIARELHDEIGQTLTGLHLLLAMADRVPGEYQRHLDNARLLLNDLMARVREMSLDLRPAMLDDLGLLPTLRWHFKRYTTQTSIQVLFKHSGLDRRFTPEIETAIYRLVQEALTNVARYARVNELTVRIWANQQTLGVQIDDQGVGFDYETVLSSNTSSGLAGMRERVLLLGGQFRVRSAPGAGTCLIINVPLHPRESMLLEAEDAIHKEQS